MPTAKVNDINLYYEVHGQGPPLLFIGGLGYGAWMWFRQTGALAGSFRVIVFDNRGSGGSDKPDYPYTIKMMARDAAGLLSFLEIVEAGVVGISMGGMIAQELALLFPQKVRRLILGCTAFGGSNSVAMPADTFSALTCTEGLSAREMLRQAMATAFRPGYMEANPQEIHQILEWRLEKPTPRYSWLHQFNAVAGFNSEDRLKELTLPVLIVSGDADRVLPVENSYLLKQRIMNSRLHIFPGAGHLFFIEEPERFNRLLLNFMSEEDD